MKNKSKIIYVLLHDFLYKKVYVISLFILLSCFTNCNAEEIKINPCSTQRINISDKYNFFSVENEDIKSIIGNVSTFDIQRLNKKILFFPKAKREMLVSIITSSGKTKKLLLNVKTIEPQEITLNLSIDKIDSYKIHKNSTKTLEAKSLKFLSKIINGLIQFEPVMEKATIFNSKTIKIKLKKQGYFSSEKLKASVFDIVSNKDISIDRIDEYLLEILRDKNIFYILRPNTIPEKLKYHKDPELMFLFGSENYVEKLFKNKKYQLIVVSSK